MAGDGGPPVCFIVCAFSIHFITDSSFLGVQYHFVCQFWHVMRVIGCPYN